MESVIMSQSEKENIISKTVDKYDGKLMDFIRPKVRNLEDAEDILQEVWYQFSNLSNISDIVNISSWLFSVTRNKITDNYRKKRTESLENFTYEDEEGSLLIQEFLLENNDENPEAKYFQDEIWKEIFNALDELPEKQKQVYLENEIEGKTLQTIADEQNENVKTIISRKQYAVKHLRMRLNQLYNDLNNN
ncbi:RNA polymerase sigma factor [Moheibacter sediminis]|uniref:RNA polymerase sigma factor, sigma-70 family n=1 Tax=Moheibacter sediminis TaxID=1434700 RepID=A0A1W1Z6J0_9FLAO|nr:sigma-70 family RNA polymerase sigma factor [Moheibacter sediminis]SMC43984.1 RNA polymerase sigma factor, sigma-70 family [Moheibacter sediminis]